MDTSREPRTAPAWARWTVIAITVAAAAFRLRGLAADEPWFDEVFSIVLAADTIPELWRRALEDQTNPPGGYLLLWGWVRLGGLDLAWLRLLPFLAATLTIPATALAARAVGLGWTGAVVAAALAAASPLLGAMATELRAYAPLALAATLTLGAAARGRHGWTALGGVTLVLLHYFGALAVAAIALGALRIDRARWRAAILPAVPATVVLGGWMALVVAAADGARVGGNADWIGAPETRALLSFGSQVVGTFGTTAGAWVVLALLLGAVAVAVGGPGARPLADGAKRPDAPPAASRPPLTLALALAVLPPVLVLLLSALTGRQLWLARYLIIVLPGWFLLLAHAVERAPGRLREAALAALLTWAGLAGLHAEASRPRKTAWSPLARALTAAGPQTVCTNEAYVALPLRFQALGKRIPLTVLDLAQCDAARAPGAMVYRLGTESSLERLRRAGAVVGRPRELGTTTPRTAIAPLRWPAATAAP